MRKTAPELERARGLIHHPLKTVGYSIIDIIAADQGAMERAQYVTFDAHGRRANISS